MDLALFNIVLTVLNVILTIILLLASKKLANDFPHVAGKMLQSALTDVAPTIQEAISNGLSQGLKSVAGSVLARNSAVSRQLKAAEREVISQGISQATGLPIGDMAAKYLQKYPALQMVLPMLLQPGQKSQRGSQRKLGKM